MSKKLEPAELLKAEKDSYRLFGFTATEFTERITGAMIDKWATIYDSHIATTLVDETAPPEAVEKFSSTILESFFLGGRFRLIFNGWKEYVASTIFHIPSNITLPGDEAYQEAKEYFGDDAELDAEAEAIQAHVRELRAQIEIVEAERRNTQLAIQAIQDYKKAVMEEEAQTAMEEKADMEEQQEDED